MRRKLVIGNWKMNGAKADIGAWLEGANILARNLAIQVGIAPAALHANSILTGRQAPLLVGGQDCSAVSNGARTGEVSAAMLADAGCDFVLVGHSERRQHWGESSALVAQKFFQALDAGLTPVLCVGETREERAQGVTRKVLADQIGAVIAACGVASFASAIVAYEPVWAIGTGLTASPEQAQEIHAFIRGEIFADAAMLASSLLLLYGGSVKGSNAKDLFAQKDIDGGLIGGASLIPEEFAAICRAAAATES